MKRQLTTLEKKTLLEEFEKHLEGYTNGEISFSKDMKLNKEKIKIFYTPEAFSKTVRLIMAHTGEIAWHCLVRKVGNDYEVYDVLCYPQAVGPASVHVKMGRTFGDGNQKDPTKYYADWYNEVVLEMPEEKEADFCGQCHSHVTMSTSPSQVDLNQQKEEISLKTSGFYLFQIWNKRLEVNTFLYDIDAGILYEKDDVDVLIEEDEFIKNSFNLLVKPNSPVVKKDAIESETKNWNKQWKGLKEQYDDDDWADGYNGYGKLNRYQIDIARNDWEIDYVIEAHTATEADELFKEWMQKNLDVINDEFGNVSSTLWTDFTLSHAVRVSSFKPLDLIYEDFFVMGDDIYESCEEL